MSPTAFTASLSKAQSDAFEDAWARSDSAAVEAILATVQLDAHVSEELVQAVASLCPHGEHVAVRSSALEEESTRHSFAGQFETFLFVPPEHVEAKVIAVWRSGFSERVLAYRLEHGLGIVVNPPVVLVQRMVNANIAGVAFSADPVTGRRSVAIVSALYGLGTALVSGECDADSFAVDRSGTILSPTVVEKKTAYRHLSDEVEGVQKEGGVIRSIDIAHFDDELRRIYRVVIASFRDNFLAGPIAEVDFLEQKRLLRPYVRPELVLLAECEGEPVGFAFVIPDWLQAQRGAAIDTIVVKTLAIHPAYAGKGLGTLLAGRVREIAHNLGYTRAIHAFMHERNLSRRISRAYGGQIIRHYALYSKTLEGWT